jgi:hypothetical protein
MVLLDPRFATKEGAGSFALELFDCSMAVNEDQKRAAVGAGLRAASAGSDPLFPLKWLELNRSLMLTVL